MFEGQPKGLYALALANTGERFGYYTMLAVFVLFLKANFGWEAGTAGAVYSSFLALVYLLPLFGGMLADKIGYSRCVTTGIIVMFLGYAMLSIPAGAGTLAAAIMFGALIMISVGTSLFKGNLQVMVGDLYNSPEMQGKRDSAFSIFYMAINIGALFAPTAAVKIMEYAQHSLGVSEADSYHYAFGVACISLIVSIGIYYGFQGTFKQVISAPAPKTAASKDATAESEPELSKQDTKDRIVALCLVFAVVIFFWMAFHQNGLTLTLFAEEYTATHSSGLESMAFDVTNLLLCIVIIYALFSLFQSKTGKGKGISGIVILACLAALGYKYTALTPDGISIPAVQPLLRSRSHPREHGHLRLARQQGQGTLGTPQNRARHARGRHWLCSHDIGLNRCGRRRPCVTQLAYPHLPHSHLRRAVALAHGHLVRVKGSPSQTQGYHDGRLVCSHCCRQHARVNPRFPLGQSTLGGRVGRVGSPLPHFVHIHLQRNEETRKGVLMRALT